MRKKLNFYLPFGKKNLMVSRTKKRIKAEDWEKLTAEYNEQAAENNFVQRTSTQCQNRILNLKEVVYRCVYALIYY